MPHGIPILVTVIKVVPGRSRGRFTNPGGRFEIASDDPTIWYKVQAEGGAVHFVRREQLREAG